MPIWLSSRRLGDITIVHCSGRIVEGDESTDLERLMDALLPDGPYVILHLGDVDFIDSSGLGLLVRYLTRARKARGTLKLCAVSPKVAEVLRVTHLQPVFESYETEADAIGAIYRRAQSTDAPFRFGTDILCADESEDLQAYLGELLGQAGYGVITAGNVADALILLQATRPKLVVISARLRLTSGAQAAETLHWLARAGALVELPPDFSRRDAGEAGRKLLDRIRAIGVVP